METLLLAVGRISGLAGAALFVFAIAARLLGIYWVAGFQVGTMMQASVAAMVLGCFCLLMAMAGRNGQRGL